MRFGEVTENVTPLAKDSGNNGRGRVIDKSTDQLVLEAAQPHNHAVGAVIRTILVCLEADERSAGAWRPSTPSPALSLDVRRLHLVKPCVRGGR